MISRSSCSWQSRATSPQRPIGVNHDRAENLRLRARCLPLVVCLCLSLCVCIPSPSCSLTTTVLSPTWIGCAAACWTLLTNDAVADFRNDSIAGAHAQGGKRGGKAEGLDARARGGQSGGGAALERVRLRALRKTAQRTMEPVHDTAHTAERCALVAATSYLTRLPLSLLCAPRQPCSARDCERATTSTAPQQHMHNRTQRSAQASLTQ